MCLGKLPQRRHQLVELDQQLFVIHLADFGQLHEHATSTTTHCFGDISPARDRFHLGSHTQRHYLASDLAYPITQRVFGTG
ncbi:Uncharacterised protein [Serratia fonticola]|nr:Uncharacterised protein [Serratia fonticola]